ncbi:TIGR03118 family protein [Microvirga puerhi]|uniref:TIGR03118 family protein n=1 Tax=Microvirga puerhi TaxID=2876078 RepID=A0ABS7VR53_9HYPH|nr:TIGR03118 family protein [Microvirga puerhi]MBZ6078005.1 TIGR03118 family protein [Microvirga puerhi]
MDTVAHSRLHTHDHSHHHPHTTEFLQTNLVSDGFVEAPVIDPNLINPWGVSMPAANRFWVSDNGTGVTTIYNGKGTPQTVAGRTAITIATPPGQTTPASPTGQVFNSTGEGFNISSGDKTGSSIFMFATEDGTISGWNPTVNSGSSVLAVDNSQGGTGAVYKGLAIADTEQGARLYATNFRSGKVEVYDQNFQLLKSFTDENLPQGFAPFNVQVLDNRLFVTFALQNAEKHDDVAGPGNGFVDEFSLQGRFLDRVASHGPLNSPWGLAIAPSGFGKFSHDLLVGNFGDGTINAFDKKTDKFEGKLRGADGAPISIGDLWAIVPGSSGQNGDSKKIFFTAGVQDEAHGLFGTLSPIQEHNHGMTASMPSSHMSA